MWEEKKKAVEPVYVIEAIPVKGEHALSPADIAKSRIPAPEHLRLSKEIGRGAVGHIHAALDRNLLRHVAMKRLDAKLADTPMYRDGFIAEAQITGQLEHQNIVPVHQLAISPSGVPYFTMKLVHGEPFNKWLANPWRQPGSNERIELGVEILVKVCDALAYAHHRGVIHRDLKPQNVMVGEFGQVYLLDWGLARLTKTRPASGDRAQMEAKGPVGTPTHFAPEQARGNPDEIDERSEVFGIGAMLYEVVTGVPPYGRSRTGQEALEKAKQALVLPFEQTAPNVRIPARLGDIVMKAVAPDPTERYPTIVDLQADMKRFLHGGLHLPTRSFAPGDKLMTEGDVGHEAFMITQGSCRVVRHVDGEEIRIAEIGPGDVVGEMALLLDEPRGATVEATTEVVATVLDRDTMRQGVGASGWTSALIQSLAKRFNALEKQIRSAGIRRSGAPDDEAAKAAKADRADKAEG